MEVDGLKYYSNWMYVIKKVCLCVYITGSSAYYFIQESEKLTKGH